MSDADLEDAVEVIARTVAWEHSGRDADAVDAVEFWGALQAWEQLTWMSVAEPIAAALRDAGMLPGTHESAPAQP